MNKAGLIKNNIFLVNKYNDWYLAKFKKVNQYSWRQIEVVDYVEQIYDDEIFKDNANVFREIQCDRINKEWHLVVLKHSHDNIWLEV